MSDVAAMLDTNVVSRLMRDPRGNLLNLIRARSGGEASISIVRLAELRFGIEKSGFVRLRAPLEALLEYLRVHLFDAPADQEYGRLRAGLENIGRPIGPYDMLIAAHALALNLTPHHREYPRILPRARPAGRELARLTHVWHVGRIFAG